MLSSQEIKCSLDTVDSAKLPRTTMAVRATMMDYGETFQRQTSHPGETNYCPRNSINSQLVLIPALI